MSEMAILRQESLNGLVFVLQLRCDRFVIGSHFPLTGKALGTNNHVLVPGVRKRP